MQLTRIDSSSVGLVVDILINFLIFVRCANDNFHVKYCHWHHSNRQSILDLHHKRPNQMTLLYYFLRVLFLRAVTSEHTSSICTREALHKLFHKERNMSRKRIMSVQEEGLCIRV